MLFGSAVCAEMDEGRNGAKAATENYVEVSLSREKEKGLSSVPKMCSVALCEKNFKLCYIIISLKELTSEADVYFAENPPVMHGICVYYL